MTGEEKRTRRLPPLVPPLPVMPEASVDVLPTTYLPSVSSTMNATAATAESIQNRLSSQAIAAMAARLAQVRAELPPLPDVPKGGGEICVPHGHRIPSQQPQQPQRNSQQSYPGEHFLVTMAQSQPQSQPIHQPPSPQPSPHAQVPLITPRQWMERVGGQYPTLAQALRMMPRELDWSEDDQTTAYELRALVEAYAAVRERFNAR